MRVVALEEHYTTCVPRIVAGISPDAIARRGFPGPDVVWTQTTKRNELADLGDTRVADMGASEITCRCCRSPAAVLTSCPAIDLARAYNDTLAEACARHPSRSRGFAHLPMLAPEGAADEPEPRSSTSACMAHWPTAPPMVVSWMIPRSPQSSPAPRRSTCRYYLHPGIPTSAVRNAYYDGLPGNFQLHPGAVRLGLARRYRH